MRELRHAGAEAPWPSPEIYGARRSMRCEARRNLCRIIPSIGRLHVKLNFGGATVVVRNRESQGLQEVV